MSLKFYFLKGSEHFPIMLTGFGLFSVGFASFFFPQTNIKIVISIIIILCGLALGLVAAGLRWRWENDKE